jgi:diguanylate cyclase (GGDEF)-like protein
MVIHPEESMKLVKQFTSKDTIWKSVGVIGLILILIKLFLGQNKNLDTGYILFFSFLASACIWLGVYYHRPYPTKGWYMLAFGQFFDSIGNIFFCIYFYQGGAEVNLIYEAIFYVLGGLFFFVGMLSMIKTYRKEISASTLINGLIITFSAGIFIWVLVLKDDLVRASTAIEIAQQIIFVLTIILIVFILALIIMLRSGQIVALYLIFGAGIIMIVGILNYFKLYGFTSQIFILSSLGDVPFLELFYALGYLLVGIAFLHPSIAKFQPNTIFLRIDANRNIINILGLSFLLIPVTYAIQIIRGRPVNDLLMLGSVSFVYILVFLQVLNLTKSYYQMKNKNLELNNQNEMLKTLANIDHITKLFNRKFLFEFGEQALKNALFIKKRLAIAMIKLDDFDIVLSMLTRQEADVVLLEISNAFLKIKRKDDIVIRYGDSEFVIIFDDIRQELDFKSLLDRFRDKTKFPIRMGKLEMIVSFSAGISFLPDDGTDINTLVEKADLALIQARLEDKETIKIYSEI